MSEPFVRIDIAGLQELVQQRPELDVIDVRERSEWDSGHVPFARHVPLSLIERDARSAINKDGGVILICQKGGRSAKAATAAAAAGIADLFSVDGGTEAWSNAGLPLKRDADERKADVKPAASDVDDALGLDAIVGKNLKHHRGVAGLSLDDLAARAGVSRTLLGQIEIGRAVPSIGVVWKLAQALSVPFSTLLSTSGDAEMRVLKREDAKRLTSPDGRFVSRALFPFGEPQRAEFYELWFAPRAKEEALPHRPGTRENLVVTHGRLALTVGKEQVVLETGDALSFHADVPHAYENLSNSECWAYLVMTYDG